MSQFAMTKYYATETWVTAVSLSLTQVMLMIANDLNVSFLCVPAGLKTRWNQSGSTWRACLLMFRTRCCGDDLGFVITSSANVLILTLTFVRLFVITSRKIHSLILLKKQKQKRALQKSPSSV